MMENLENEYYTVWSETDHLMMTRLSGNISIQEVKEWESGLLNAFKQLKENTKFKMFVNIHGFKATDISTHKYFRDIIPLLLSKYNWRVGYLNLFEEAKDLPITMVNGIECIAAVHCHDDETKIKKYQDNFGTKFEKFSTNPIMALRWIKSIAI